MIGTFIVLFKPGAISHDKNKPKHTQNLTISDDSYNSEKVKISVDNSEPESGGDESGILTIGSFDNDKSVEIYAKSLVLNCPREITVQVGSKIKLTENCVKVEPETLKQNVSIYPTSKNKSNIENLSIVEDTITAKAEGYYNLNFEVQKSKTDTIKDTIIIHAVPETSKIKQLKNSIYIDKNYNLSEIFETNNSTSKIEYITDNKIRLENEIITGKFAGESQLKLTLLEYNIIYNFEFKIEVKQAPKYEIVINNDKLKFEENKNYYLPYQIVGETCSQTIKVESENVSIITVVCVNSPLITLKAKSKGEVNLKITYLNDQTITKTITLIVE